MNVYSNTLIPGLYLRTDADLGQELLSVFADHPDLNEVEVVDPCHRCDNVGECGGNSPGLSPLCPLPRNEVACPCCGAPIALTGAHSCPGCGYSL